MEREGQGDNKGRTISGKKQYNKGRGGKGQKKRNDIHDSYASNGGLMRPPGEPVHAVLPPQAHLTVVVACTGYGRHALKTETPMMVLRKVIQMKNMVFET